MVDRDQKNRGAARLGESAAGSPGATGPSGSATGTGAASGGYTPGTPRATPPTGQGAGATPPTQAGQVAGQLKDQAGEAKDRVQEQAGDLKNRVVEQATTRLEEQKEQATGGIGSVAHAVRQTGQHLREQDQDLFAGYAERAAEQLETFTGYLRRRDLGQMVDDVQRFARREPALFLGGAFALGLIGARFLKSSGQAARQDVPAFPERPLLPAVTPRPTPPIAPLSGGLGVAPSVPTPMPPPLPPHMPPTMARPGTGVVPTPLSAEDVIVGGPPIDDVIVGGPPLGKPAGGATPRPEDARPGGPEGRPMTPRPGRSGDAGS